MSDTSCLPANGCKNIPSDIKWEPNTVPPQYTDHGDQVIEKGTSLRLKILGVKPDVAAINAIGTIKEDFLGSVLAITRILNCHSCHGTDTSRQPQNTVEQPHELNVDQPSEHDTLRGFERTPSDILAALPPRRPDRLGTADPGHDAQAVDAIKTLGGILGYACFRIMVPSQLCRALRLTAWYLGGVADACLLSVSARQLRRKIPLLDNRGDAGLDIAKNR